MTQLENLARRVTALERQLNNLARIGTIAQLDTTRARVRVKIGPLLTDWLPWLTQRAGPDSTWHPPELGEQVLVISQSGNLTLGIVIPAIYQTAYPAPADTPDIDRRLYADGALIEYDRAAHKLTATIPGSAELTLKTDLTATLGGNLTAKITGNADATIDGKLTAAVTGPVSIDTKAATDLTAAGPVTLKAPTVTIDSPATTVKGALTVIGPLTFQGGMAGSGSAGGGTAATIQGDLTTTGDVKASGISLTKHTHGGVQSGLSITTPPS